MSYDQEEEFADPLERQMLRVVELHLEVGFMFTQAAATHRRLGNKEYVAVSRRNAAKAAAAVRRYETRLPEEAKARIMNRCSELEEAIAAL